MWMASCGSGVIRSGSKTVPASEEEQMSAAAPGCAGSGCGAASAHMPRQTGDNQLGCHMFLPLADYMVVIWDP